MDTAEQFSLQWKKLMEERQQIVDEADQLKQKLGSLTVEPTMRQLIEEKSMIKKKIPELNEKIKMHRNNIEGRTSFLEYRHSAMSDKLIRQKFIARVNQSRGRLERLKKLGAPEVIMQNEEMLIWKRTAPIAEVEQTFRQQNIEEEQKQQEIQHILDETLSRIATIEKHYRQTKHSLEDAIRETERKRFQCRAEEINWATQSRSHLEWMLEHQPSYRDEILGRYKMRFPADNLSDLFPPIPTSTREVKRVNTKKRHSRSCAPAALVVETTTVAPQSWRFWVTFNANDPGQELPQAKDQFLQNLQSAIDKEAYHNLDVQLVYEKLLAVTKMSMQQRQEMHKLIGTEPMGWKILRAGKKHRLFLLIDEEMRHIRFLPRQRKKSYSQH